MYQGSDVGIVFIQSADISGVLEMIHHFIAVLHSFLSLLVFCPFNLFHVHAFLVHLPKRGHFTKLCNLFFDELDGVVNLFFRRETA